MTLICQHKGGEALGTDGKVNTCELLINVVMLKKLNVLKSFYQKVCRQGVGYGSPTPRM